MNSATGQTRGSRRKTAKNQHPGYAMQQYFRLHFPNDSKATRAANALVRSSINSMEQLSEMKDEQILNVRNLGSESLAVVHAMLRIYRAEMKEKEAPKNLSGGQ